MRYFTVAGDSLWAPHFDSMDEDTLSSAQLHRMLSMTHPNEPAMPYIIRTTDAYCYKCFIIRGMHSATATVRGSLVHCAGLRNETGTISSTAQQ